MLHYFLVGFLILFVSFLFFYRKTLFPGPLFATKENMENNSEDETKRKTAELLFFTVDWCPHCKVAQPEWDKLVDEYEGQLINGKTVVFTHYNCTKETPEITDLIAKYGIKGYPTVKLLTNGQVIDFDAKPTEESLLKFLKASL